MLAETSIVTAEAHRPHHKPTGCWEMVFPKDAQKCPDARLPKS